MMNHHDEDDGPCNRHPAGSVEPMYRPDLRAKKHTKPSYETPARIFRDVARRQARAAAEAALAGVL